MKYSFKIVKNDLNNLPLRVITWEGEDFFVLDDLIRLAGLEGLAKQLLNTIIKSGDSQFRVRKLKVFPLEGYENTSLIHTLVDRAAANYILDNTRVNSTGIGYGYEYNSYMDSLTNWFKECFGFNGYDDSVKNRLKNSLLKPKQEIDFINFY